MPYESAIESLDRAVLIQPENTDLLRYEKSGKIDMARKDRETIIKLDPSQTPGRSRTVVTHVIPNGFGAKAGLRVNDEITSYSQVPVLGAGGLIDRTFEPGTTLREIKVIRDGKILALKVKPGPLRLIIRTLPAMGK